MEEPIIQLRGIKKVYTVGVETIHALRGVDLDIRRNEMVAIMGSSGSGKSTLMNTLGCLDRPTSGEYYLGDQNVAELDDDQLVPLSFFVSLDNGVILVDVPEGLLDGNAISERDS